MLDAALPNSFFPDSFIAKKMKNNKLNLLWVGRFMPRKGILLILDVMNSIKDNEQITLTVVGDGEQKDIFLQTIKSLELKKTVFWKGKVPYHQVKEFYKNHDAFFITSLRDSGPSQLIEAMAYGLPIITLNIHGQAFIVNEDTGFRCACKTPEEAILNLKSTILKLYNDPQLLTKMSNAAYQFALKQTWENKINEAIEKSYKD
jgi:glycosyltransferase involved in cell wall biosynthesis